MASSQKVHERRQELLRELQRQFHEAAQREIRRLEAEAAWLSQLPLGGIRDTMQATDDITESLVLANLDSLLGRG